MGALPEVVQDSALIEKTSSGVDRVERHPHAGLGRQRLAVFLTDSREEDDAAVLFLKLAGQGLGLPGHSMHCIAVFAWRVRRRTRGAWATPHKPPARLGPG